MDTDMLMALVAALAFVALIVLWGVAPTAPALVPAEAETLLESAA